MTIYLGADHRGFKLKESLRTFLADTSYNVVDMGAQNLEPTDDYVDVAKLVAQKVAGDKDSRGILLCGSGVGMCIAANKIPGIRCAVGHTRDEVQAARQDDDINILALAGDYLTEKQAFALVDAFLRTEFLPEERFLRRIAKLGELDRHA